MVIVHRWCRVGRQRGNQGPPNHAPEDDRGSYQPARHAPVYCLSIFAGAGQSTGSAVVEDDKETAALIRRIVNAFAARWPAVLSDNTMNPMIPLGPLAEGQPRQSSQQEQKRGWRRLFGG